MAKIFTKTEVLEMVTEASDPEMKAIIGVLMCTGARVSEVCALRGKDITSDDKFVYLNMKVLKKRNNRSQRIVRPITKNNYFISFLRNYINNYADIKSDDLVFTRNRTSIWRELKRLNPEAHPHKFRHTLATWMLDKVDMRTAQEWFQWANLKTAETYTHPKDAINTFSSKMGEVLD